MIKNNDHYFVIDEDFTEASELASVFGLSESDVVGELRGHKVYLNRDGELLLVLKSERNGGIGRGALINLAPDAPTPGTVTAGWSVTGPMHLTHEEVNSLSEAAALQKTRKTEIKLIREAMRHEELKREREKYENELNKLIDRDLFEVRGGSGYGHFQFEKGKVYRNIRYGIVEGEPEFFFVLESKARYHGQNGGEYGVGSESGYSYLATCRAAKESEIHDLLASS